jgi:D-alanyl-lipoteichoic acid acyltransferase DltB (MBOAT superfamily)
MIHTLADYFIWMSYCIAQFAMIYWGMAGVASLQSGLMRIAGFEIADRFQAPFLANSPGQFWERWNTYVAAWFRRHVFFPIVASKYWPRRASRWRWTVATVTTFLGVGLAHEYALLIGHGHTEGAPTIAFLMVGCLVSAWMFASRWLQPRIGAVVQRSRVSCLLASVASRVLFLHLAIVMAWLMIPALSGAGFPASISRMLGRSARVALQSR